MTPLPARERSRPPLRESSDPSGASVDAFEDAAPDDLLDLFREIGLPIPNPLWYVGRLMPPKESE